MKLVTLIAASMCILTTTLLQAEEARTEEVDNKTQMPVAQPSPSNSVKQPQQNKNKSANACGSHKSGQCDLSDRDSHLKGKSWMD